MKSANTTCTTKEEKSCYPRTGKRGVPQQFPRKLYEMLEFEAGSLQPACHLLQSGSSLMWIATGRGFRITNVEHFSEVVLPKWFKVCLIWRVPALNSVICINNCIIILTSFAMLFYTDIKV
jgi:hypothetical protein